MSLLCGMKLQIITLFTVFRFLTFCRHINTQNVPTPHTTLLLRLQQNILSSVTGFYSRSRVDLCKINRKSSSPSVRLISDESRFQNKGCSVFETEVEPSIVAMVPHPNLCSVSLYVTRRTLKWFFVCTEFKTESCVPEGTTGPLSGRSSAPLASCQSSAFS